MCVCVCLWGHHKKSQCYNVSNTPASCCVSVLNCIYPIFLLQHCFRISTSYTREKHMPKICQTIALTLFQRGGCAVCACRCVLCCFDVCVCGLGNNAEVKRFWRPFQQAALSYVVVSLCQLCPAPVWPNTACNTISFLCAALCIVSTHTEVAL